MGCSNSCNSCGGQQVIINKVGTNGTNGNNGTDGVNGSSILYHNYTPEITTTNVGVAITDESLSTFLYSLPAGRLDTDGDSIRIEGLFKNTTTLGEKYVEYYFGTEKITYDYGGVFPAAPFDFTQKSMITITRLSNTEVGFVGESVFFKGGGGGTQPEFANQTSVSRLIDGPNIRANVITGLDLDNTVYGIVPKFSANDAGATVAAVMMSMIVERMKKI